MFLFFLPKFWTYSFWAWLAATVWLNFGMPGEMSTIKWEKCFEKKKWNENNKKDGTECNVNSCVFLTEIKRIKVWKSLFPIAWK